MRAIDRVRAHLQASGLRGEVEKKYHKLLRGYWFFPEQGGDIYLGRSAEVAIVAIDSWLQFETKAM